MPQTISTKDIDKMLDDSVKNKTIPTFVKKTIGDTDTINTIVQISIVKNYMNVLEEVFNQDNTIFEKNGKCKEALIWAAMTPSTPLVAFETLGELYADYSFQGNSGDTCLMHAVSTYNIFGKSDAEKAIHIEKVEKIIKNYEAILIQDGHSKDVIKAKIEDFINMRNNEQESAFDNGVYKKPVRDILVKYGADINAKDKDGKTCGYKAVDHLNKSKNDDQKAAALKIITPLIQEGLNPTIKDNKGNSVKSIIDKSISEKEAMKGSKELKEAYMNYQAGILGNNVVNFVNKEKENIENGSHVQNIEAKKKSGFSVFGKR